MQKFVFTALLGLCLTGALFTTFAHAEEATPTTGVDVAVAAPTPAKTAITASNLPLYLDEDLASKHADFARFAKSKVTSLNRNHILSRSRMQIIKQADGTYRARFHAIDDKSLVCKVRRSKSKTIPYVGVASFKEKVFEAVGDSPNACRVGEFIPVAIIPNRHIFSYKKGHWE